MKVKVSVALALVLSVIFLAGCGLGFRGQTLNLGGGVSVHLDLPGRLAYSTGPVSEDSPYIISDTSETKHDASAPELFEGGYLMRGYECVGSIQLGSLAEVLSLDDPQTVEGVRLFKEDPAENYRALFDFLPKESAMYLDDNAYRMVYQSKDKNQGAAVGQICFRLDPGYDQTDLSHHRKIDAGTPENPRTTYALRYAIGYHLDCQRIVTIMLNYDAVTDTELEQIAESLRITKGT